jgi:hypothetical protein
MEVSLKDFKTGWFEVQIELTKEDIDSLIRSLKNLKGSVPSAHFHCSSDFRGKGGIGEVEISLAPSEVKGSFSILELKQPETKLPP